MFFLDFLFTTLINELITYDNDKLNVIKYVSTNYSLFLTYV